MKKAILDVPLWERPEDCKLYVHLHRMDCFLSVIWTLVLILTMLDLFAIAEKLVSAWTFAPLFAAILFIPIIFRPRLRSKWRCPNCQTAFPYRNILARVDHIYGGYIQELRVQKIPFISSCNIVFPSKCPTCGQYLYEQSYGKSISEIMKPTIKIWIVAAIIFGISILVFFGAIIIAML